ncbi:MAG: ABC transporter permease [Candidatus Eremiobacteraeota bacterium]|nr:ABC transporter permease [Candidatus Eremiobacteraeota bacterium]
MSFLATLRIALKALNSSKMRTALTMLGIIIGVASVISMLSIGQGVSASVSSSINSLGTNALMIMPGQMAVGGVRQGGMDSQTLTVEDFKAIARECPSIAYTSPLVRKMVQAVYGNQNLSTTCYGINEDYEMIRNWPCSSGNFFTSQDVASSAKVCLLGKTVADNLFGSGDPLGEMVRIKNVPFRVIGILSPKGSGMGGDQDDCLLIPYTTAMERISNVTYLNQIMCSAVSEDRVQQAQAVEEITGLLRQRHKLLNNEENNFSIRSQADIAETASKTTAIFTIFLSAIACVSLLVGGIGIMNIMLVSVTERIREIGIRLAMGARGKDILMQFLTESVILSLLGGLIGILLGVGLSKGIAYFAHWNTLITVQSVMLSFLFSAAVGVFFGFYPAFSASKLNPIDALRHE